MLRSRPSRSADSRRCWRGAGGGNSGAAVTTARRNSFRRAWRFRGPATGRTHGTARRM